MIVDLAAYVGGSRVPGVLTMDRVAEHLGQPESFVWLGLRMPSRNELVEVRDCFGLTQLGSGGLDGFDVDEALAPHDRPVLTRTEGLTWLVLRTAAYNDALERVALGELSVLFGPDFVITIRHGRASPLDGLRRELEARPERLRLGPPAVFAAIVNQVVDDHLPALDGLERDAIEVEAEVFGQRQVRPVRRLYLLKRQVRELSVAVNALHDPLARLLRDGRGPCRSVAAEVQEALDQLARVVQRTASLGDLLTSALDAHLALVSVQQNEDMRKISAWIAIAAVPTMAAGIYGMNFEHMPELRWRFGYPVAMSVIAIVCLALYRSFRNARWL